MDTRGQADAPASQGYLLLADISGYTSFMAGVEEAHGVDFSVGIPVGCGLLGAVLDAVVGRPIGTCPARWIGPG